MAKKVEPTKKPEKKAQEPIVEPEKVSERQGPIEPFQPVTEE